MALRGRYSLVCFGDSITQFGMNVGGWVNRLASEYQRTADISLRGFSGYNTRWALQLTPEVFPKKVPNVAQKTPDLVCIMLGANDANLPPPLHNCPPEASRQHVPIDEYKKNLSAIVSAVRSCGDESARVLLLTPPPVDGPAWHRYCIDVYGAEPDAEPNRTFENTRKYAEACIEVAKSCDAPVVNMFSAVSADPDWKLSFVDGLHPNVRGNQVIYNTLSAAIKQHFPDLNSETLPLDFPDHKTIDYKNPVILPSSTWN